MNFMRHESRTHDFAPTRRGATMRHGIDDSPSRQFRRGVQTMEAKMTWQTPTATDFRFGFEITMYVAAR